MQKGMTYLKDTAHMPILYPKIYIMIGWKIYIVTVCQSMTAPSHWMKQKICMFHLLR